MKADTTAVNPSWIETETIAFEGGELRVRVGIMGKGPKGDVLYLHGFADRFDNHRPLFDRFVEVGLRVIAFDYPSHGETDGRSLDMYGFDELAALAGRIERAKAPDVATNPLYLAGWSTGGLLAVRIAQGVSAGIFSRPIAGMALFAPGVEVRTVTTVSDKTLTSNENPPHVRPPKPDSPIKLPVFALALLSNAQCSRQEQLPPKIPTLVMIGGDDEDKYVNTPGIVTWVEKQRKGGAKIVGLRCTGAFHELDNEPEPIGGAVRDAAARFLASKGTASIVGEGKCRPF